MITVIDLPARTVIRHIDLAYGKPGFPCPPQKVPHAGPHKDFGCFTDTNAVVMSSRHGGVAFTANGGTDDISVIDVRRAVSGVVWIIDVAARKAVGRVSGVGNETYLLALLPAS